MTIVECYWNGQWSHNNCFPTHELAQAFVDDCVDFPADDWKYLIIDAV